MVRKTLGRLACVMAMIGLSASSVPTVQLASAATPAAHTVRAPIVAGSPHAAPTVRSMESGRGWGAMIGCSACLIGAGVVIAGGPAAIIIAVNAPGSSIALLACAATCYEAFQ